jgi:hypothetical protein
MEYRNSTMVCEGFYGHCKRGVARVYHPFCGSCFRSGIARGSFVSRDGHEYKYDGRRWISAPDASVKSQAVGT